MEEQLPPLPNPAYGWYNDYYDGWNYIENPSDRWHELNLFTEEQMRSYALQAVLLERERCAKVCDALSQREYEMQMSGLPTIDVIQDYAGACAAAIRKG